MGTVPPPIGGPTAGPRPFASSIPALAVTSLVLGILGVLTSFLLVGAFMALAGLVFGAIHLRSHRDARGLAWSGVGLSVLGILATVGFGTLYLFGIRQASQTMHMGATQNLDTWVGQQAPDFALVAVDGTPVNTAEFRGRRVVLDFWATWCPPCVKEVPHFVELRNQVSTNDLVVIGISKEDRLVLKPFIGAHGVNYPIASAAGTELPAPFGEIGAWPTTFFLDRAGRIEHVAVGYRDYAALHKLATAPEPPGAEPTPANTH